MRSSHCAEEALVAVGVLDAHGAPRLGDVAGDPLAQRQLDGVRLLADHDAREQPPPLLVEQVEGGPVRLEQLGDLVEDELEELIEIEGAPQRQPDVAQRLDRLLGARERDLELADAQPRAAAGDPL